METVKTQSSVLNPLFCNSFQALWQLLILCHRTSFSFILTSVQRGSDKNQKFKVCRGKRDFISPSFFLIYCTVQWESQRESPQTEIHQEDLNEWEAADEDRFISEEVRGRLRAQIEYYVVLHWNGCVKSVRWLGVLLDMCCCDLLSTSTLSSSKPQLLSSRSGSYTLHRIENRTIQLRLLDPTVQKSP